MCLAYCPSSLTGSSHPNLYSPSSTSHFVTRVTCQRDTNLFLYSCIRAQNIGKMPKSLEIHMNVFTALFPTFPPNFIIPLITSYSLLPIIQRLKGLVEDNKYESEGSYSQMEETALRKRMGWWELVGYTK